MRKRKAFVDGDNVSDTVSRVNHDTSLKTLRIEGKHGLDGDVDTIKAVLFKHDLAHFLAVALWIHGRLGEEDLATLGIDPQLFVKGIVPDWQ